MSFYEPSFVLLAVRQHRTDRVIFHVPTPAGGPACGTHAVLGQAQTFRFRTGGWFVCRGCERYADLHYPGMLSERPRRPRDRGQG